jgi:hypothetical protein
MSFSPNAEEIEIAIWPRFPAWIMIKLYEH